MNLYKVVVQRTVIVSADNAPEAEQAGLIGAGREVAEPDFVHAQYIDMTTVSDIPKRWVERIPYGESSLTCRQIINAAQKHPSLEELEKEADEADVLIIDRLRSGFDEADPTCTFECNHCHESVTMEIPAPQFCPRCGVKLERVCDVSA